LKKKILNKTRFVFLEEIYFMEKSFVFFLFTSLVIRKATQATQRVFCQKLIICREQMDRRVVLRRIAPGKMCATQKEREK